MKRNFTQQLKLFACCFVLTIAAAKINAQVSLNYAFSQTTGTYTPITGGTVLGTTTSDDQRYVDPAVPTGGTTTTGVGLPIGFTFFFNGDSFDVMAVNTNGWISLGSSTQSPAVNNASTSSYNPLASTSTITPAYLRARIAAFARDLQCQAGSEISYATVGTAPNRELVVQFTNMKKYGTGNTADTMNFQIRLEETSNLIRVVYGQMINGATSGTCQVGLGGPVPTDFNNRVIPSTGSWAASNAGTTNSDLCNFSSTLFPSSGTTYIWTPIQISATNVTVTPQGDSCLPVARTITVDVTSVPDATAVVLNSATNGISNSPVSMTLVSGTPASGTWSGVIPAASGSGLLTTTFNFNVTDANGTTGGPYTGGTYNEQILGVNAGADVIVPPGQTTVLTASAIDPALYPLLITEVTQFETGTGATSPYPAYMNVSAYDYDGLEISNVGSSTIDVSGFQVISYTGTGPTTYTYTIPQGTTIPSGGVLTFAQNTAAVSSPADGFYAMATGYSPSSSSAAGYVLTTPQGIIIDAVGLNSYAFPASTGVTGSIWSGNISSSSGLAGVIRTGATDSNTSTDWSVSSASLVQTLGTLNAGLTIVAPSTGAFLWTPGGATTQSVTVGPFTTGTYPYTVSYTLNGCTNSDEVLITVPACFTPTGVTATNLLDTSAVITWTSTGVTSYLEYGPVGFTPGTGTFVYGVSSPYTLTGLMPQTTYTIYVTDSCVGSLSDPTAPVNFTTQCSPFPYPGNTPASAIVITGSAPFTDTVVTLGNSCYTDASALRTGPDVFYRFTADPCATDIVFSLCGSSFDTYLYIRDSANTTTIASNDDAACGLQSEVTLTGSTLIPGQSYLAVLEPFGTTTPAGTYTVTVTQTLGGVAPVLATSSVNASCPSSTDGTAIVTITANGSAPVSYLWSNTATTDTVTGVAPGNYTVLVTNGCMATATASVDVFGDFDVFEDITNVTCNGQTDGAIDLTLVGETAPVFTWSSSDTTEDLNNLAAGTYALTIVDGACNFTTSYTITEPVALAIATDSVVNLLCNGGSTGEAFVTVTGGEMIATAVEDSLTTFFTGGNGCGGGNMFDLTVNTDVVVDRVDLNINASQVVNIYVKPGTYTGFVTTPAAWTLVYSANVTSAGANSPSAMLINPPLTLPAGQYGIYINADVNYTNIALGTTYSTPEMTLMVGDGLCSAFGGTNPGRAWNGRIHYNVYSDSTYLYNWSSGDTTEDVSGLSAGSYTLTVTDANGCSSTTSITLTEPATAVSATVDSVVNVLCNGNNGGEIQITPSGGTGPYTYSWTGGDTIEDPIGLLAGAYTGTVADIYGCEYVAGPVTVTEPTAITANLDSSMDVMCSYSTDGALYITISGGTGMYDVLWDNGDTTEDIVNLSPGSYIPSITDENGCVQGVGPYIVNSPDPLMPMVDTIVSPLCYGGTDGAIMLSLSGATVPYELMWSTTDTTEDISGLAAGMYVLSTLDGNGCMFSDTFDVTQPDMIALMLDSSMNVTCNGSADGAIYTTPVGGYAPYSIVWNTTDTTDDLTGLNGGMYYADVTDNNGCVITSDTITLTESDSITVTVDTVTDVLCRGNATGAVDISANGGTAPLSFEWSNTATTEDISALAAGPYKVTVTDANGCSFASQQVTVDEPATAISATSVSTDEVQGVSQGSVNVTVTGGTTPYTYLWSNGQTGQDLVNVVHNTYTCTISDANGCQFIITDTVNFITGIEDVETGFTVSIYPNPTQTQTRLELKADESHDISIEIFNMSGQLISTFHRSDIKIAQFDMDFSKEAAGVYYAKIKVGDALVTKRIVVTR